MFRSTHFLSMAGFAVLVCFLLLAATLAPIPALAQNLSAHHGHEGMSMDMPMDNAADDPALQAKLFHDKKESEFNHHLAGIFVILAGSFILSSPRLSARWPLVNYAWPLCFLLSGIFVLIFSDTELWPFGPKNWWIGVTGNLEVLQHKTFALILVLLGVIELLRARGTLRAAWSAWIFPVLAFLGSAMLLFHAHDAGMHGSNHMQMMSHIQNQHLSYAALGTGIALSKGISDTNSSFRRPFSLVWPILMISLGILLTLYTE